MLTGPPAGVGKLAVPWEQHTHTYTHAPTPWYRCTGSPAKKATLFPGFRKKTPLTGISQDSLVILWDGMSITNKYFPQSKEKKTENWPRIQYFTVCFHFFFPREIMWALSAQYQYNDILVLCNLLGKRHYQKDSGIATSFIKSRIL